MVFRKLGRTATHRRALLRNLVTALIEHESITTTHAKAKEAQTYAERLITLAKQSQPNDNIAKNEASAYIFKPSITIPKLFTDIADRYKNRAGGYTRVLRLENRLGDNAPQSILELVGGKRDMRRALTARAVARYEAHNEPLNPATRDAVNAIIKEGPDTKAAFEAEVKAMKKAFYSNIGASSSSSSSSGEAPVPPVAFRPKQRAPIRFVKNPLCK